MSRENDTAQYSECRKCGGRIVKRGPTGWYHQVPSLHSPRHYAEPAVQAIYGPAIFATTAQQMARHFGLVGEVI